MAEIGAIVNNGVITNQTTPDSASKSSTGAVSSEKEQFLGLLVAQMKYQDPLEPTSNTEYISQYATFSSLEQMQNMSNSLSMSRASEMVGKTVTIKTDTGSVEGVVDYVTYENNKAKVNVNGNAYSVDDVTGVLDDSYAAASDVATKFMAAMDALPSLGSLTTGDLSKIETLAATYDAMTDYTKGFISSAYQTALEQYLARAQELSGRVSDTAEAAESEADDEAVETVQAANETAETEDAEEGSLAAAEEEQASANAAEEA